MFKSGQKLDRLIAITEEQNSLLRELLAAFGHVAKTRPALKGPIRQSTEKDVRIITRADRIRMQEEARQAQAPWREPIRGNGRGSATISPSAPSNTSAASQDDPGN